MVPDKGLHLLHCMIVPLQHITSMCDADALLLREVDTFKVRGRARAPALTRKTGLSDRHAARLSLAPRSRGPRVRLRRNRPALRPQSPLLHRMHSSASGIRCRHCLVRRNQKAERAGFSSSDRYMTKAIEEEGELLGGSNPQLIKTFGRRLHNCIPKDFP